MAQTYLFPWPYTPIISIVPSNFRKCIWAREKGKGHFHYTKEKFLGKKPEIRYRARMGTSHRLLLTTAQREEAEAWMSTEQGLQTLTLAEARVPVE